MFIGLEILETINLEMNQISTIEEGCFEGLKNLKNINLNHNFLISIEPLFQMTKLPVIEQILLDSNKITQVPEGKIEQIIAEMPFSINRISVEENPIECDCQVKIKNFGA